MKRLLYFLFIFSFSLLCTPSVFGQKCSDYPCVIANVKKAMSAKNYKLAFEQLESAEGYPSKNVTQITELRKQLFNAVEKEKDEAKRQKERAENLLKELRETSDQAVQLLINEIDRNILRLEYDSTFEKCQIAVNLKSEKYKEQVKYRVLEIAYFYTETDTVEAAVKTLKLLNINALPNRNDLHLAIEKNAPPQCFTFLEERYYPKMITVEGGTFHMKDDSAKYEVRVNDFEIAKTETTFFQYNLFTKAMHHHIENPSWQFAGDNPAVNVSWYDAVEYSNWLSMRKNKKVVYEIDKTQEDPNNAEIDYVTWIVKPKKVQGYRLPTEAEWEFAAIGGNKTHGFIYSGDSILANVAWYKENSDNRTHAVATKKANELGLYDMSGNESEWCQDWYSGRFNVSSDKQWISPEKGYGHSVRGGAWNLYEVDVLDRIDRDTRADYYGFRVVIGLQDK